MRTTPACCLRYGPQLHNLKRLVKDLGLGAEGGSLDAFRTLLKQLQAGDEAVPAALGKARDARFGHS